MSSGARIVRMDTRGLRALLTATPGRIEAAADALAQQITNEIVLSFNTSPAGREYRRPRGKVHVASQPGYPPNVDLGTLKASIKWTPAGGTGRREISDGVEYGAYLEFGTETIAPRPFFGPAFEAWTPQRLAQFIRNRKVIDGR